MRRCGTSTGPRRADGLLVADLSSLWAGPLCGQLLARAGAVVVKVESPSRPDGTRRGEPAFFDWMNAGKLSYCLDFDSDSDALRRLLDVADIVIEGSRPAALRRRGLSAEDLPGKPGRIWLRINGYRDQPDRPRSGMTPRLRADWLALSPTGRCSAATRSRTRSPDWRRRARWGSRCAAVAVRWSRCRWPR